MIAPPESAAPGSSASVDAEQRNIAQALLRRPPIVAKLLDDKFLRGLHKAMFDQVWDWAGRY